MADDLAAIRARNSVGFVGEHPPEGKPDPLTAQHQAMIKRLGPDRVKENKALDAAQRKAFAGERKPAASKAPRKARARKPVKVTPPKTGD